MVQGKDGLALPVCLIIMDGFGLSEPGLGNAIDAAATPVLDGLFASRPWVKLEASGEAVGLPEGQMGNSEVGHLNIGAGRRVYQELTRINNACRDGSLAKRPVLQEAFSRASAKGSALHLLGLLSDGGVHSSNEHLYALIEAALGAGVKEVLIHCFMDGRDTPPESGAGYMQQLLDRIGSLLEQAPAGSSVRVASISGRYYAMDRDNRWERVERAYDSVVCAANLKESSAISALEASYEAGVSDEFVVPVALEARGMRDGDAAVFFNFRPDRARELTRAIVEPDFRGFNRCCHPSVYFACLTEYDPAIPADIVFPKEFPEEVLADVLAKAGLRQYHIAETEKYAHVTFFFNGGREEPKAGEARKLIASPKVATYDLQPQMSEPEVADALVAAIENDEADVYIVNFANCDMVGHTGSIPAAVAAVESVDEGVGKVVAAMEAKGGITFITADHGNADCMIAPDGQPHTAHTTAPVPFILVDASGTGLNLAGDDGVLADIAPTLLAAAGLDKPQAMTGRSLLAS